MNCQQVQELLPLYVGRDLEQTQAQLVAAHVESCSDCDGSLHEYRETRQLLHQFTPPQFSEGDYAGVRQRVLREIARESTAPTLRQSFASLFRPRLSWAAATALLLVVSVFAYYFIANRRDAQNGPRLVQHDSELDRPASPQEQPNHGPTPVSSRDEPKPSTVRGVHRSQRTKNSAAAVEPTRVAANKSLPAPVNDVFPGAGQSLELNVGPALDSSAAEKTLRMEMQTKDPNIRIIWFAHSPNKSGSPNKSLKGI